MTYVVFKANHPEFAVLISKPSRYLKLLIVGLTFAASPIAQVLHPAAQGSASSHTQFNIAGVAQYITVGLYICYFGSYSIDLFFYRGPGDKANKTD